MPALILSIGILVLFSAGSVLIANWVADRRIVEEFTSPSAATDVRMHRQMHQWPTAVTL